MTFQDRLRDCRKQRGLTQKQAAELFSIGERHWRAYELGTRHPSTKTLHQIANYFNVSLDYLEGHTNKPSGASPRESRLEPVLRIGETISVPVYDNFMAVCAGRGTAPTEGAEREILEIPSWLLGGCYSNEPGKTPFIITVHGDSMEEAAIPDGSQILVNPMLEANDGDVVVAEYFGDVMLKWLYWHRDGGGELRSSSTKYPARSFTREDVDNGNFVYLGKVCHVLNKPRRGE